MNVLHTRHLAARFNDARDTVSIRMAQQRPIPSDGQCDRPCIGNDWIQNGTLVKTTRKANARTAAQARLSSRTHSDNQPRPRSRSRACEPTNAATNRHRHRFIGFLAGSFAILALIASALRALPADVQELPYVPIIVAATPWFAILALLALLLAVLSRRVIALLLALVALGLGMYWQYPFFLPTAASLPQAAHNAMVSPDPNTKDAFARVMTCNVFKGQADPQAIVDLVRDQRVEVLALQETTDDFVQRLKQAGIEEYLPYAQVSSSDGVFGNGIWSATPLGNPADDDVNSSASFMPGGTVDLGGNRIRFVSVHTTAPVPGYWHQWKRSLDELGLMRTHTDTRYIFMGDFNATYDHAPFRDFLGDRFQDATRASAHGFTFSWPTNRPYLPRFAGIDHVVLDRGMTAGQCKTVKVPGSDHAALLATVSVLQ